MRRDGSEFASKDTLAAGARALFSASARTSASNDTTAFHPKTLDHLLISKVKQHILYIGEVQTRSRLVGGGGDFPLSNFLIM